VSRSSGEDFFVAHYWEVQHEVAIGKSAARCDDGRRVLAGDNEPTDLDGAVGTETAATQLEINGRIFTLVGLGAWVHGHDDQPIGCQ